MGNKIYTVSKFGGSAEEKVLTAWKLCAIRHAQQYARGQASFRICVGSLPFTGFYGFNFVVYMLSNQPLSDISPAASLVGLGFLGVTMRSCAAAFQAEQNVDFYERAEKGLVNVHQKLRKGSFDPDHYNRVMDEVNLFSFNNPHGTIPFFDVEDAEKRFDRDVACYYPEGTKSDIQ